MIVPENVQVRHYGCIAGPRKNLPEIRQLSSSSDDDDHDDL